MVIGNCIDWVRQSHGWSEYGIERKRYMWMELEDVRPKYSSSHEELLVDFILFYFKYSYDYVRVIQRYSTKRHASSWSDYFYTSVGK